MSRPIAPPLPSFPRRRESRPKSRQCPIPPLLQGERTPRTRRERVLRTGRAAPVSPSPQAHRHSRESGNLPLPRHSRESGNLPHEPPHSAPLPSFSRRRESPPQCSNGAHLALKSAHKALTERSNGAHKALIRCSCSAHRPRTAHAVPAILGSTARLRKSRACPAPQRTVSPPLTAPLLLV